jgi:hypothetical protein
MLAYMESSHQGMSAALLTANLMPEPGSCIGFYYQVRAGQMVVNLRTSTSSQVWQTKRLMSAEWEYAYITIPDAQKHFRLSIEAKHVGSDIAVNVALDDLQV